MQHVSSFFQVVRSKVAALWASERRGAERWRALLPVIAYAVAWTVAYYATVVLGFALSPKIEGPSPLHVQDAVTVAALLQTSWRG